MINPASLLKAKKAFDTFQMNHPKVISFVKTVIGRGVTEGTIIEITVTKPGEDPITTNMKVQASDIELFRELQNLS